MSCRKSLVGQLRHLVAGTAVAMLEPDLVILDEFQRFRDLLGDPEADPTAELAQSMMSFTDPVTGNRAKVLLLSATPYKPLSLRSDEESSEHYAALLAVRFLAADDATTAAVADGFAAMHHGILGLHANGLDPARRACDALGAQLRELMARTERLAV